MRVVTFEGQAVKRQKKISDDKILLVFYNRPPRVVTPDQWDAGKQNKYYDGSTPRKDVVRSL
jgi:hypothetical protein